MSELTPTFSRMWTDTAASSCSENDACHLFSAQAPRFKQFRRYLAEITFATIVVIAIGTLLVFLFERPPSGTAVTNIG